MLTISLMMFYSSVLSSDLPCSIYVICIGLQLGLQIEGQTNRNAQIEMHKKTSNVWQITKHKYND
jgi:hypothetical protein